jgi:hypothetical protein
MSDGCGCLEIKKDRTCYENQKKLAQKYSKAFNEVVALYQQGGEWHFITVNAPEIADITPLEYIHPLQ